MATEHPRVLVTRASGQNTRLRLELETRGCRVIEIPSISISEPDSWEPVDIAIAKLADYDWILFTSANAVDAFTQRAAGQRLPKVAVVGSQTARRAEELGIEVSLVPEDYRSERLLAALPPNMAGVRVIIPRGNLASESLPHTLESRGARVDAITVYKTSVPVHDSKQLRELLSDGQIDCVSFTSGSTVRNFVTMLDISQPSACMSAVQIAVIGPVTRQIAEDLGLNVSIEASEATTSSLAECVARYFFDARC